MPRVPTKPKAGKGQVLHLDLQQCDNPMLHVHDLCACDPTVDDGNVRHHIKNALAGHWPLTSDQDIVICPICEGAVQRASSHRAALNYQPLKR